MAERGFHTAYWREREREFDAAPDDECTIRRLCAVDDAAKVVVNGRLACIAKYSPRRLSAGVCERQLFGSSRSGIRVFEAMRSRRRVVYVPP